MSALAAALKRMRTALQSGSGGLHDVAGSEGAMPSDTGSNSVSQAEGAAPSGLAQAVTASGLVQGAAPLDSARPSERGDIASEDLCLSTYAHSCWLVSFTTA